MKWQTARTKASSSTKRWPGEWCDQGHGERYDAWKTRIERRVVDMSSAKAMERERRVCVLQFLKRSGQRSAFCTSSTLKKIISREL